MNHQLSHIEHKFSKKKFSITVICDHLNSPANQGALFRICEAFGVQEIIYFGNTIDITSSRLKRTARSTENTIPYRCVNDISEIISSLKENKSTLLGLEITKYSRSIKEVVIIEDRPITLVIGSEKHGISKTLLEQLDQVLHIPMYGSNSSMNVIQATAIALFQITSKLEQ